MKSTSYHALPATAGDVGDDATSGGAGLELHAPPGGCGGRPERVGRWRWAIAGMGLWMWLVCYADRGNMTPVSDFLYPFLGY